MQARSTRPVAARNNFKYINFRIVVEMMRLADSRKRWSQLQFLVVTGEIVGMLVRWAVVGADDLGDYLTPSEVGTLAGTAKTYYDNFKRHVKVPGESPPSDVVLSEEAMFFFAKSKTDLKTGMVSASEVRFAPGLSAVVVVQGTYDSGAPVARMSAFGKIKGLVMGVKGGHGFRNTARNLSHGTTASTLRQKGYYVMITTASVLTAVSPQWNQSDSASWMGPGKSTNKDVASMLNHDRAVVPDDHDY